MISDSLFDAAFHSSPIGQYLLAPTAGLEILAVNDAFLRSVSRRREEVLGMPLFEAFGSDPDDPGDTGVPALGLSIRTAIDTGQAQVMTVQRYPIKMQKDGRTWFEDMYWSATNAPVYDTQGRLTCVSHTTINITAQVLAEQALRVSREEALRSARMAEADRRDLVAVLRAAPIGILVADRNLRVLHVNPTHECMFGAVANQAEQIDFRHWNGWFIDGPAAGHKLEPEEWPLQRACAGHTTEQCLLRVESFTAERSERLLLISAAPILAADATLVGAVAVSIDIEDRVRAEDALKDAGRRKDEFLAMLAHELRNPLAPIGAAASLLSQGSINSDHVRRSSDVIARQVRHMTGLINELLDVARVTRGLIALDKTVLDANRIVADAVEQVRPAIEARHHNLQVRQLSRPAFVEADHKRLVQVLANLLNNAAKFTPEGGIVKVELAMEGPHVRLTVEDNGIGMTLELIDKAFDLFTQADRTPDRSQGGLGIGLALVRTLVSLHGGHVTATSAGPGNGSRFTVCLPALTVHGVPAEAGTLPGLLPDQSGLKILLVDDNEDNLMVLEMLLTSMGHEVVTTSRPGEAIERARVLRPDVCLFDIGLPDINGLELAARFRSDPLTRAATLMAMSGYGQETDKAAALEAGFARYFVKPVDVGELAAALVECGRRRNAPA